MKYLWNSANSPVSQLHLNAGGKNGVSEALLFLNTGAETPATDIDTRLIEAGYSVSYDVIDGQSALRVTGFKNDDKFVKEITDGAYTQGEVQTVETEIQAKSLGQKIRKNSLSLSAAAYTFGNAATFASGFFRNDKAEMTTAVAFEVGDATMMAFGHRTGKETHRDVMQGFRELMADNGFLPSFGSNFSPMSDFEAPSMWGKVRNFMHDKVILVKSVSEIIAGVSFAAAGVKQGNNYKIGAGTAIASGFGISLATAEKTNSELREQFGAANDQELAEKVSELPLRKRASVWLQQHTLTTPAFFALINNVSTTIGAFQERAFTKAHPDHLGITPRYAELQGILTGNADFKTMLPNKTDWKTSLEDQLSKAEGLVLSKKTNRMFDTEYAVATERIAELTPEMTKIDKELKQMEKGRTVFGRNINQKDYYKFNLAQAGFMAAGNIFYGMSSKNNKADGNKLLDQFVAAVASETLRSTEGDQMEVINIAAHYAATRSELDVTMDEARALITQKMADITSHHALVNQASAQDPDTISVNGVNALNITIGDQSITLTADMAKGKAAPAEEAPAPAASAATEAEPTVVAAAAAPEAPEAPAEWVNTVAPAGASKGAQSFTSRRNAAPQPWEERSKSQGNEYGHHPEGGSTVGVSI